MPAIGAYKEKPFKSVTRGGADLDKIARNPRTEARRQSRSRRPSSPASIALFKLSLGDAVKDVRSSERLTDSAVCLVADEGDMDMHLERLLKQHRQLDAAAKRILEINPSHPLIARLADLGRRGRRRRPARRFRLAAARSGAHSRGRAAARPARLRPPPRRRSSSAACRRVNRPPLRPRAPTRRADSAIPRNGGASPPVQPTSNTLSAIPDRGVVADDRAELDDALLAERRDASAKLASDSRLVSISSVTMRMDERLVRWRRNRRGAGPDRLDRRSRHPALDGQRRMRVPFVVRPDVPRRQADRQLRQRRRQRAAPAQILAEPRQVLAHFRRAYQKLERAAEPAALAGDDSRSSRRGFWRRVSSRAVRADAR